MTHDHRPITDVPSAAPAAPPGDPALGALVRRAVARRRFGALATTGVGGRPHVAGVLYGLADGALWVSTMRSSRKARNIVEDPRVAVMVPIRRLPVGPPSSVQLQASAEVVGLEDPRLRHLADGGELGAVTGHGELELDGGCFLRIALPTRVPTYGLGMSLPSLLRDPLGAGRVALVDWR